MNNTRPSAFFAALLRIRILLSTETEELGTRLAGSTGSLVPRPFIQRVYRDPCWGWLGLGPRLSRKRTAGLMTESRKPSSSSAMAATNGGTVKAVLLPALQKLNQELKRMLENGRKNFEAMKSDRLDEFLNVDCEIGLRAIAPDLLYVNCLQEVGVKTRAELEDLWKGCYHEEVRECVEEIMSYEENLQELYDNIDAEVVKVEDQLAFHNVTKVGELLPAHLSLTECKSQEVVHLESFWKQSKFTLFVPLKFYF